MTLVPNQVRQFLDRLRTQMTPTAMQERLSPQSGRTAPQSLRTTSKIDPNRIAKTWHKLQEHAGFGEDVQAALCDATAKETSETYAANIENFVGTLRLPVGVIGPLRINGINANGDYHIPLATTEAALVASYARGSTVATKAGGIAAAVLYEGVIRTPAFVFDSLLEAGLFVDFVVREADMLQTAAEETTGHGKLVGLEPMVDSNIVFLRCRYTTGDAAGQNMVTIATDALCHAAVEASPVTPQDWYIEGNFSGDKKASYLGFLSGRGRKATASVTLPSDLVERYLNVSVDDMLAYAEVANLGARLSGQIGAQGHFANGLAALYLATGQDAACVSESAIGSTRMERRGNDLFMSVTLPNILVGTVGGGTGLPTQSAGLEILGLKGSGHANAFAEVVAATCLCGEISIMAAIAGGHFTHAHRKLARHR